MTYEYKIINKETKEELKLYPIHYTTKKEAIEKAKNDIKKVGKNYFAVLLSFDWVKGYKNCGIITSYETQKDASQNA